MSKAHKKENAVAIVVNQAFIHYAKPLINSIKKNWPSHPLILMFLSPDVKEESVTWFKQVDGVVIKRYNPHDFEYRKLLADGSGKFDSQEYNDAGFFFLNFWNDTFSEYNNILVLDVDMLVLKDLTELVNQTEFVGISAANERFLPAFSVMQPMPQKMMTLSKAYFKALRRGIILKPYVSVNGGVILISAKDRTKESYLSLIDILKNFRNVCPTDQELILLWMNKHKKIISHDFRMNFHSRFYNALKDGTLPERYRDEVIAAAEDIHIMHFNGPKPDSPSFLDHPWTRGQEQLVEMYNSYL